MEGTDVVTTSIIIPVYNDPEGLETTVESLLDQTVDDYEIIIADNGSTDRTQKLAKAYATRERVRHVVEDEIQGSYAARNAGITIARGEILCFVDADMWVDSDWVEQVQERMRDDVDYLGCNVEIVVERETICAEYNRQSGFPVKKYIKKKNFAPTCCLVVRSAVIADVGRFDERLRSGGDVEFGHRVHGAGYRQAFAEEIEMYHPARDTLYSLLSKYHRIGRGDIQRSRYHTTFDTRHPLHPFGFLPVRPTVITGTFGGDTRSRQLLYFALAYVLKLSGTAGRIREWLRPTEEQRTTSS